MKKRSKKSLTDRIYDFFYAWFARSHPESKTLIAEGFSRADLRYAYEAGYRRARAERTKQAPTSTRVKE